MMAYIYGVKKKQSMGDSDKNCDNQGRNSQADIQAGIRISRQHIAQSTAKTYLEPIVDLAASGKHGVTQHNGSGHRRGGHGE